MSRLAEGRCTQVRRVAFIAATWIAVGVVALAGLPAVAQDWFQTGTGLGVSKARLAVSDFTPRNPGVSPLATEFGDVVRADLNYSGIVEIVSKSYSPTSLPSVPTEVQAQAWSQPPVSAQLLAYGNLSASGTNVEVDAWLNDVRDASLPPEIGKVYRGPATAQQVRAFAHQFADEIVARLTGGLPGIASTQIAFVSARSGNKEIWVMDYDGANQRQLTSLHSIALTPRFSPDASRIAYTCYPPAGMYLSAQICMYSMLTGKGIAWPRYRGTNSSPAWSPDGSKIMFMSSMLGNPELWVANADGTRPKRLTYTTGANTSPAWNPKTGQEVAFVSDRGGPPQLYMMDADGSNATKVELVAMGYVIDPSWSPNGELLAFSWRRPDDNYDIYVMDIATHQLLQLTRDAGRNERPSWAPDGRHIVFESTRTGTRQIWSMLADGSEARQLTTAGQNESPSWSSK
ncbi:MAG: Tol-Pal system beta propeller repeat protein TolB [Candidatus Acidiferrales bacterium]